MHEHVVLVKLHDPDDGADVVTRMRTMAGRIDGMTSLAAARNEISAEHSYDVILRTRFETRAAYDSYATDPVHVEVADYVRSKMSAAATCDYEVEPKDD